MSSIDTMLFCCGTFYSKIFFLFWDFHFENRNSNILNLAYYFCFPFSCQYLLVYFSSLMVNFKEFLVYTNERLHPILKVREEEILIFFQ